MAIGNARLAALTEKEVRTTKQLKVHLCRYFYLGMSLVMAALVVWGFSRTVDANLLHANPRRPLLLWMHATAFSTWVLFFILQPTLVRVRKVSLHRFLGWFGAGLATVMVPLGFTIAVIMARFDTVVLHQQGADAFLSIPFADMIIFGSCVAMAIYWRKKPEYHRRLVFIASCQLMDAAIGRFDFWFNHSIFICGLGLSDRDRHGARLGGGWTHPQGVSLCAAPNGRCPESCDLRLAGQSQVVAGDHTRDPGVVKAARLLGDCRYQAFLTSLRKPADGWVFPSTARDGHLEQGTAKTQHSAAIAKVNAETVKANAKRQVAGEKFLPLPLVAFEPYVMRHTALTRMAPFCDAFTLARIAGHSSITITQRYCHPQADAVEAAFSKFGNRGELVTEAGHHEKQQPCHG